MRMAGSADGGTSRGGAGVADASEFSIAFMFLTGRTRLSAVQSTRRNSSRALNADETSALPASSPARVLRPRAAFNQNLAVGRHARFGGAGRICDLEFDADNLLDAVVAKVCVLGR